jgi:hypothetical protein
VGNILRRHNIAPAPERSRTTTLKEFIRSHMDVLAGSFTVEVLTWRGLVIYFYEQVLKSRPRWRPSFLFFSRSIPQIEADQLDAAPVVPIGGMRRGGFSGAYHGRAATTVDENSGGAALRFYVRGARSRLKRIGSLSPQWSITRTPSGTTSCRLPLG